MSASMAFNFVTMNDPFDPTFNQLLGIGNQGNTIVGYFGSGADAAHPNKGYILNPPGYITSITPANFPNSVQTQQIGINDNNVTCGFYIDAAGVNYGFIFANGVYTSVKHPNTGTGTVNQLLGLNTGYAVGFYTDGEGANHGYSYAIKTGAFADVTPPKSFNCTSTTATSTNGLGDVVGFCETTANTTISFFANQGNYAMFQVPGSQDTQALGISMNREVVGSYTSANGDTHGFIATVSNPLSPEFRSLDHPSAPHSTVINGINNAGFIVGFFVDGNGNTNGMLGIPAGNGTVLVFPGSGIASSTTTAALPRFTAAADKAGTTSGAFSLRPFALGLAFLLLWSM